MNREVVGVVVGFLVGVGVAGGGWFLLSSLHAVEPGTVAGGAHGTGPVEPGGKPGTGAESGPDRGYSADLETRIALLEQENKELKDRLVTAGQDVEPVQPDQFDRVPGETEHPGETVATEGRPDIPPPPPALAGLADAFTFLKAVAVEHDEAGMEYVAMRLKDLLKQDPGSLPQVVDAFRRAADEYEITILGRVLSDYALNTYEDNDQFEGQLLDFATSEGSALKRRSAVETLTFLNVGDEGLQRIGTQIMAEQDIQVRAQLVAYLAAQSAAGRRPGREHLLRLARTDEADEVRAAAVAGLSYPDPEGARVLVEAIRSDSSSVVRSQAARALWLGGAEAQPEMLDGLVEAIQREQNRDVVMETVSALAVVGGPQAVARLQGLATRGGEAGALADEYLRAIQGRENLNPDAIMNRVRAKLGPDQVREGE